MDEISEIREPELLDPDRVGTDSREHLTAEEHRDRAEALAEELRRTCGYGRELWRELQTVREYLVGSLPRPASAPDRLGGASPTGPADERGWAAWLEAYASVVEVLAGPKGNPEFGREEGRRLARARLEFPAGQQPTAETITATGDPGTDAAPPAAEARDARRGAAGGPAPASGGPADPERPPGSALPFAMAAGAAGLLGWVGGRRSRRAPGG